MVATALSGFLSDDGEVPAGVIVTAVFPGGCQLRCGFCIVRQRDERGSWESAPPLNFYTDALRKYAESGTLAGASIIGDEPLQELVWPYVEQFLDVCTRAGRPSTLITNGLELRTFAARLERFRLTKVVVSLDAIGAAHDRIRGKRGAFEQIKRGICTVELESDLHQRLAISTILRASHLDDADAVLRFVAKRGIRAWIVSPLLDPRPGRPIRIHRSLKACMPDMLRALGAMARDLGVSMTASDEFALVDEIREIGSRLGFSVKRPNTRPSLIRLDAKGRCWTWDQVTNGLVDTDAPGWRVPIRLSPAESALAG